MEPAARYFATGSVIKYHLFKANKKAKAKQSRVGPNISLHENAIAASFNDVRLSSM